MSVLEAGPDIEYPSTVSVLEAGPDIEYPSLLSTVPLLCQCWGLDLI